MLHNQIKIGNTLYSQPYNATRGEIGIFLELVLVKPNQVSVEEILNEITINDTIYFVTDGVVNASVTGFTHIKDTYVVFNRIIDYEDEAQIENPIYGDVLTIVTTRPSSIDELSEQVTALDSKVKQLNPVSFIVNVPASSGNTTTVMNNRIRSTSTVLSVQDYYTGLEINDVSIKVVDGAVIISNITKGTALKITFI